MSAFLEWLNSSEPCTPAQGCAVVVGVVALVAVNFWVFFGVIEPLCRRLRNKDKAETADASAVCAEWQTTH